MILEILIILGIIGILGECYIISLWLIAYRRTKKGYSLPIFLSLLSLYPVKVPDKVSWKTSKDFSPKNTQDMTS